MSEDQTVYTFKLRDDIFWSDGQPVVAENFVYSWQRLVNPETAADYGYFLDNIVLNAAAIQAGEKEPSELGIVALDEMWWSRLPRLGRRDQLSLMWCLRRCGIPRDYLLPPGQNTRNHPGFRYLRHK